ncbi:MAG: hypothetical protein ACPLKP_01610 [Microgenomates group bacterium]
MPKTIIPVPIRLFFIFLILTFLLASPVKAWLDCPFGEVNDPYPGQCSRYLDTNNNQICDHSEPPPSPIKNSSTERNFSVGNFLIIVFLILISYFLTKKFFSPLNFRLFWNLILLASFLPVGISGFLLFLNIKIANYYFWHDQLGIVFGLVAFLHLIERLNYFKQTLSNKIKSR